MTAADANAAYDRLSRYVSLRTGLALPTSRRPFIEAGIARAAARARRADIDDYLDLLVKSDAALDDLVAELSVGETYFFRESGQFEYIRSEILPELRGRLGADHELRAWSAGCASGEEAYSLAILFEEEWAGAWRVLGSDISRAALVKAQAGTYGEWSLRYRRRGLVERYFQRHGGRFVLAERLRRRVNFAHLNLAADDGTGYPAGAAGMDVILCRNVLIYIAPERIPAVAQRLFAALADSGWLITGPSDPLLSSYAPFRVLPTPAGLLYRREPPIAVAPRDNAWPTAILTQIASAAPPPAVLPAHPPSPNDRALAAQADAIVPQTPSGTPRDIDTAALEVQSLANLGLAAEAERAAARAAADGPLTAERHILHAITLLSLRRFQDAADAARRAVYLAPDCPVASLILGVTLHRLGAIEGARRALRAGRALVAGQRADRTVPGSGGESAARLAAAATAQLALLDELRATLQ